MKSQIYPRSAPTTKIIVDRSFLGLHEIILRNRFQERFLKTLELEKGIILRKYSFEILLITSWMIFRTDRS